MPRFTSTTEFDHATPERTGVLLVQLGTPDAPHAGAVRRFLAQFLGDPRVVEIPRPIWRLVLHGLILRTRPRKSAAKYLRIWTQQGSPLAVYTRLQSELLRGALGERGLAVEVAAAMRNGKPSIASVLRELRDRNVTRLLVVPLYPQYSGSTTASSYDAIWSELRRWRNLPELRTVRGFHVFDPYIEALVERVRASWMDEGPPDRLVISFHGLPRRMLLLGDPYHCECLATARRLAARLGLPDERVVVSFQSRLGRARWLEPYTDRTLAALGRSGVGRVDVVCPGFVADCLETLEEIAIEGRETFLAAGGREFRYIPCLNDHPAFISALASLVQQHVGGWPVLRPDAQASAGGDRELRVRRERALARGAAR
ncbi:MAG: ferrochelatase [Burkholderiaceae bacterium]|nr:ferrochelatase [Burkholderiaceae bacterium]